MKVSFKLDFFSFLCWGRNSLWNLIPSRSPARPQTRVSPSENRPPLPPPPVRTLADPAAPRAQPLPQEGHLQSPQTLSHGRVVGRADWCPSKAPNEKGEPASGRHLTSEIKTMKRSRVRFLIGRLLKKESGFFFTVTLQNNSNSCNL